MPRTVIPLTNPIFKVADTEAGLTAGDAYECQLTSAAITASPNFQTIPPTGCAPAAQSPGARRRGRSTSPGCRTGRRPVAACRTTPTKTTPRPSGSPSPSTRSAPRPSSPPVRPTSPPVRYGGTFGDGSPAAATATWPCLDKPTIVSAVVVAATAGARSRTRRSPAGVDVAQLSRSLSPPRGPSLDRLDQVDRRVICGRRTGPPAGRSPKSARRRSPTRSPRVNGKKLGSKTRTRSTRPRRSDVPGEHRRRMDDAREGHEAARHPPAPVAVAGRPPPASEDSACTPPTSTTPAPPAPGPGRKPSPA